jgi:hypothetical protein
MDTARARPQPVLQFTRAKLFGAGAVLVINLYGFLLGLPVLLAVGWVSFNPLGMTTYALPMIAVAFTAVFLPFGFGNPHARRICRRFEPPFPREHARVVQLTTRPRPRSGLRALLEDADDIGYLHVTGEQLTFFGDSIHLEAPLEAVESVCLRNVGFRGLYIYAPKIVLTIRGVDPATFEFADRSTIWLFRARRETRELFERLSESLRQRSDAV